MPKCSLNVNRPSAGYYPEHWLVLLAIIRLTPRSRFSFARNCYSIPQKHIWSGKFVQRPIESMMSSIARKVLGFSAEMRRPIWDTSVVLAGLDGDVVQSFQY